MNNTQENKLLFPSGRSVKSARQDAKKRKAADGITHAQALDIIAKENGIDQPWAEAICKLKNENLQLLAVPEGVFSSPSVILHAIQTIAKEDVKASGVKYDVALRKACFEANFSDPELAFKAMYCPVDKGEIHRILYRDFLLVINGLAVHVFIQGIKQPNEPKTRRSDRDSLGDVACGYAAYLCQDATKTNWPDDVLPGWSICKYDGQHARIHLGEIPENVAKYISTTMAINRPVWMQEDLKFMTVLNSPVMDSFRLWAEKYPKTAKDSDSPYFRDWGNHALGLIQE